MLFLGPELLTRPGAMLAQAIELSLAIEHDATVTSSTRQDALNGQRRARSSFSSIPSPSPSTTSVEVLS